MTILLLDEALAKEPGAQSRFTEHPHEEGIDTVAGNGHTSAERASTARNNPTPPRTRASESPVSSVSSQQHSPTEEASSCAVKLPKLT